MKFSTEDTGKLEHAKLWTRRGRNWIRQIREILTDEGYVGLVEQSETLEQELDIVLGNLTNF